MSLAIIIVMLQCIILVFPSGLAEVVKEVIMIREKVGQLMRISVQ